MNPVICRKCRHWVEFVSLLDMECDVILACGCVKFHIVHDEVFHDRGKFRDVMESMRRHGRRKTATHEGKAFSRIVGDSLGMEYRRMMDGVCRDGMPKGCPCYVEHVMDGWNGGFE